MLSRNTISLNSNLTATSISSEDKNSLFKHSITILPKIKNKEKIKNKSFTIDSSLCENRIFLPFKNHSFVDRREKEINYHLQTEKFKLDTNKALSFKNLQTTSPMNYFMNSKLKNSNSISALKEGKI